jgi:hypothetical protein
VREWEFRGDYRLPNNGNNPINHAIEHSVEDFNNLTIVAWVQSGDGTVIQACNGVNTGAPTVTYVAGNNGTITATVNKETIASGETLNNGDEIIFVAIPDEGYKIKEWKINGETATQNTVNELAVIVENYLDIAVTFQETVAIKDNSFSNLFFYPNPATSELRIVGSNGAFENIEIFDAMGIKQKAESRRQNGEIVIDVSHLSFGIYFVTIESFTGNKVVHKMVKK